MELLTGPLSYAFFERALVAGIVVGALCGALSVFIVLRRMSYIGHGLAHSVLGGVAVGVVLGYDLYVGAAAATLLSAMLIHHVAGRPGLHADAAIGIVTTSMFAIGIAVVSVARTTRISTEAVLFGNILGVTRTDLWVAAGVGLLFAVVLFAGYKRLLFATFDPQVATVQGVSARGAELALTVLTAAVVIVSVRVLGVLLVAAAVVIPAATARLLTRSFGVLLGIATAIGVASAVTGLYASFYMNVPSGPTIVLTGAALFTVVLVATTWSGGRQLRRARRHAVAAGAGAP